MDGIRWAGLGFTGWANKKRGRYTAYRSFHWIYEGTGLKDLDEFWYEPTKGVEVDGTSFVWKDGLPVASGEEGTPSNFIILGIQPSTQGHAILGIFDHSGGGTVFNAGTFGWPRGLLPELLPPRVLPELFDKLLHLFQTQPRQYSYFQKVICFLESSSLYV